MLLSCSQEGPDRKAKQGQEEISHNHVPTYFLGSVYSRAINHPSELPEWQIMQNYSNYLLYCRRRAGTTISSVVAAGLTWKQRGKVTPLPLPHQDFERLQEKYNWFTMNMNICHYHEVPQRERRILVILETWIGLDTKQHCRCKIIWSKWESLASARAAVSSLSNMQAEDEH